MTHLDNLTDRLHFVAASIPTGFGVTVETAATLLHDLHTAGQRMADLLNRILSHDTIQPADITTALTAWEAVG